ncbi:MAG: ATP-binding protein [Pseudomonadota bacterium]
MSPKTTAFIFVSCVLALAAVPARADENVLGQKFDQALPFIIAVLSFVVIFALAFVAARMQRRADPNVPRQLIDEREWPTALTRLDGVILRTNQSWRENSGASATIQEKLEHALGLSPSIVYRMSRNAVRDGLSLEVLKTKANAQSVLLSVQLFHGDRLIWQILPQNHLASLGIDSKSAGHAQAPFAYARFSGLDEVETNQLFRDVFDESAVDQLREQIDSGIFSAGRIVLPGPDGMNRLALSAVKFDRGPIGESYEIFLFIPDGETSGQVSAAETLEAIPISLLHLDIEGRVFWGNAQARKMLGDAFSAGRMLGDMVQPLGRSLDGLLQDVRSGQESGSGEMVRLQEGNFDTFAQITLTHVVVQGQPSLMAVLTDASELRLLEDKFAQSQKMEAVGKLAGGVAHDFNNVLTAISGHCDLLLLRKDASHPDFSDLTQIRQNSNRAATLVKQLLAFSRKQTLQPKLLSVQDVVTDTLYLLDRLIGEKITLSLDHGRDLGAVRADNQQLEQALMNLVVNARDAMQEGGMVTIATRNRTIAAEQKHLGVSVPAGEYVEISVSDNGTGIDPQVIDKVFDPFFTTKAQGEGTGLGLSTVYGIVKQSGGYIYAENLETGGASFTILLPRAYPKVDETPAIEAAPSAEKPDLTGQGAVMLVEDEAPVRSFASRALKLRGYRVIEAESAEDAMELLNEGGENIDVLVSDVVMPGMDGPTFASKARQLRPDLRVIFISGYAEDSFRRNLTDTDFLFLSKPFSLNELTAKVKIAMNETGRGPTV